MLDAVRHLSGLVLLLGSPWKARYSFARDVLIDCGGALRDLVGCSWAGAPCTRGARFAKSAMVLGAPWTSRIERIVMASRVPPDLLVTLEMAKKMLALVSSSRYPAAIFKPIFCENLLQ